MTDLLTLTAELVDRPSPSFDERPFVDWLEAELGAVDHLEVTRLGDNLVARTNLGRRERVVLAGHTDTVPAVDDPSLPGGTNRRARIEGDTLHGVGAADMKGGLAVFLDLARSVPSPAVDLTYVFYAREEVALEHSGLSELIASRPDLLEADCAILGEPTDGAIEAGCQGALRFEVVLQGARAHTARPWMGRNAIHRLAGLLADLDGYEARTPTIDGCSFHESLQAVHVEGGVGGNVVPDRALLRIHHRFAPDRSMDEAEAFVRTRLAAHLDNDDTVTLVDAAPACPPSLSHPLLRRLRDGADLEVRAKLGWTDVGRLAAIGLPATNLGPGDPTVAHTASEFLTRDSLERVADAVRTLVS